MTARIIDGKAAAAELRAEIGREIAALKAAGKPAPGLHVVLIGEDPASKVYVASKEKLAAEIGMNSVAHRLSAETTEAALLAKIAELNADDGVDGILVQLPLPKHIDTGRIIDAIDPAKDVDGLHPINAGLLAGGKNGLVPCTPLGCMLLLKQALPSLSGLDAVVKVDNILSARDGRGVEHYVYPYFSETPVLDEQAARLGLWLLGQALLGVPHEEIRVLDVIRGEPFSIDRYPLAGNEEDSFRDRYAALLEEWEALRAEYD